MLPFQISPLVYKYRTGLSLALLFVGVYFVLYTWLVLPSLIMATGWSPDTELRAVPFTAIESYRDSLEPGDLIVSIDGRPVKRGQTIFQPPVKSVYTLEIIRGDSRLTQEVATTDRAFYDMWLGAHVILALAIWFIGYLTAQFAHPQQSFAVYAGLGFQLIGVGIISPGPAQLGAPGAWLIGHVLVVYFPFIMLYLAFAPGNRPVSWRSRWGLRLVFYGLTLLAGAAAFEVLVLFPEHSWQSLTGVRTFAPITLCAGIGMAAALLILTTRTLRLPPDSYERRQLRILLTFLTLALTPLLGLIILPGAFVFLPYPVVYSLFLLAPVGYFFILHRQGFLQLDAIFSRVITFVVLVLAIVMAYGTGVYLWGSAVGVQISSAGYGGFALTLVVLGIVGQRQVQSYVDLLIYGEDSFSLKAIQAARLKLSANPETATIANILAQVSASMQIQRAAIFVKNDKQFEFLTGNVEPFAIDDSPACRKVSLRSRQMDLMASLPAWVELSLPIRAGQDTLGLLLLARPSNAYFNARQVETIQDVADILAFGLLIISLIETMQALSRQTLYEKQLQRQEIATEIHNEPLHQLTAALMELESRQVMGDVAERLRRVATDLRRIITGLRPPILKESTRWIAYQLVREFNESEEELVAILHPVDSDSEKETSEQIKIAFNHILTEALHNVSKHAQATQVDIWLHYGEERLTLTVADNGKGGDCLNWSLTELLRAHHMGLADMHRWSLIGGGKLEIGPNRPTGTTIQLTMPLKIKETTVASIYQ